MTRQLMFGDEPGDEPEPEPEKPPEPTHQWDVSRCAGCRARQEDNGAWHEDVDMLVTPRRVIRSEDHGDGSHLSPVPQSWT